MTAEVNGALQATRKAGGGGPGPRHPFPVRQRRQQLRSRPPSTACIVAHASQAPRCGLQGVARYCRQARRRAAARRGAPAHGGHSARLAHALLAACDGLGAGSGDSDHCRGGEASQPGAASSTARWRHSPERAPLAECPPAPAGRSRVLSASTSAALRARGRWDGRGRALDMLAGRNASQFAEVPRHSPRPYRRSSARLARAASGYKIPVNDGHSHPCQGQGSVLEHLARSDTRSSRAGGRDTVPNSGTSSACRARASAAAARRLQPPGASLGCPAAEPAPHCSLHCGTPGPGGPALGWRASLVPGVCRPRVLAHVVQAKLVHRKVGGQLHRRQPRLCSRHVGEGGRRVQMSAASAVNRPGTERAGDRGGLAGGSGQGSSNTGRRSRRQQQPPRRPGTFTHAPAPVLRLSRRPCLPRSGPASTSTGVPSAAGTTVSSWLWRRSCSEAGDV